MSSQKKTIPLSLIAMGCLGALAADAASAKSFVLQASGGWSDAQTRAVEAAGGTVTFSHGETGIGLVTSDSPSFLRDAKATKAFAVITEDRMVQWQEPLVTVDVEELAVNPIPPTDSFYQNIQWAPQSVNAPEAWAAGCTGAGVRVAVIDGGIHNTHVDLVGRVDTAASRSFVPGFAYNQDTGTFWHGTHVAGIVAASANGIGTVGIAPEATIVGVKALHSGSGDFGWVIGAILYAATPIAEGGAGADIINMSLGAAFNRNEEGAGQLVGAMNKAVNYANRHGVLVVSSAGNNGFDLDHSGNIVTVPAESGSGVAVSATGPEGFALGETNFRRLASYSNYGTSVISVAAPGGDFAYPGSESCTLQRYPSGTVTTACWVFDMVLSTSRGSSASTTSYSWAAGTSMAAPAAAAVAAIIKQANPGISLGALKTRLAQSADDEGKKGRDPVYGAGYVNAYKACTMK